MLDYNNIEKLFGAPLNSVARPTVPFKIQMWHIIVGLGVLALATYGSYKIYESSKKEPKKDD